MSNLAVKKSSTTKKISLIVLTILALGGAFIYMNMGSIAKSVAEKIGSETLGVKVTIASLDISIKDRSVLVSGLSIANPEGFKNSHAMKVESINIAMNSFAKELLVFNDIRVKGTELFLEVTQSGTNLNALKKNIDQGKKAPKEEKEHGSATAAAAKVVLKHFLLSSAQLHPAQTLISGKDLKSVSLPDIKLAGIGEKQNGVLAREAISQVWDAISKSALSASAKGGLLEGMSADTLKDLTGAAGLPANIGGLKNMFGQ